MSSIDHLLRIIDAYCETAHLAPSTVSTKIFNDGKRVALLRAGGDIGTRQLAHAVAWLSDHWPAQAVWPDGVARPDAPSLTTPSPTVIAAESESPSLAQRSREVLTQQLDDSRAQLARQRVQGRSGANAVDHPTAKPIARYPYEDEDGAA